MKKVIVLILVVLLALSFIGCQTDSSVQQQNDQNEPDTQAQGDAKPYEGQTLTVLYMSSVYADAARAVAPEFEALTGAKVEVVDFPYVTLHEKAMLDLTSGTASYDVIDVACQWDGEFSPYLADLQPYIERDGYDMSVFIENVANNAGKWQGKIMGIPAANTPMVVAYRTDLLPNGIPDTWDEYLEVAKELTDKDNGMYGVSIPGVREQFAGLWDIRLWSMGGAWADEDWNVTINSPESAKALDHVKELLDYCDPAALSWGLEESIKAFLDGNAAICEAWPTLGIVQDGDNPEKSNIVGKWALDVYPYAENGITMLSAWDLAINDASDNKDLAWEWVKFYTQEDYQNDKFYNEYGILSPRNSFWELPEVKEAGMDPVRQALDTAMIWWRIPASVEADTVVGTYVSAFMSGQITREEALSSLEEGLIETLKNSPPEEGIKNYNK